MNIIHIESGLGNQMLSYCEYLALKQVNPGAVFYIENIIYDIPECNAVTCQWNGYELERVFGIKEPQNIRTLFTADQWNQIMRDILKSEFWTKNMNYPVHFCKAFKSVGLDLANTFGDFEAPEVLAKHHPNKSGLSYKLKHTLLWYYLRRFKETTLAQWRNQQPDLSLRLFPETKENLFAGQKLLFKYKNSGIARIEKEIREVFRFPPINDERNLAALRQINSCQSVAIHARRGDMLGTNGYYYSTGYFKKAVSYIRKHISNPVFFIFCDPGSIQWAKENSNVLGINFNKDSVYFVDWNKSTESYRDMQLMSMCKHQVITNSSFGWWASWLNTNPGKITCSPDYRINTTHTF